MTISQKLNSTDKTASRIDKTRQHYSTLLDIFNGNYSEAIVSITSMIKRNDEGETIESDASITLSCVLGKSYPNCIHCIFL